MVIDQPCTLVEFSVVWVFCPEPGATIPAQLVDSCVIITVDLAIVVAVLSKFIHVIDDSLSGTSGVSCTLGVSVRSSRIISREDRFAGIGVVGPRYSEQPTSISVTLKSAVTA